MKTISNKKRETRELQNQSMKGMLAYQKQMERTFNRKKSNHHMIRKG